MRRLFIGTAGWSIGSQHAASFPSSGTHLERYARRLPAVEINSSFYRPHRRATYERWAESVPSSFRFAVKLPKAVTHEAMLVGARSLITDFAKSVEGLGTKLGGVLVQLPPRLAFDRASSRTFFEDLQKEMEAPIACEPRHASWFTEDVDAELAGLRIARVGADPPIVPGGDEPGGYRELTYFRLHGAPRTYYSPYSDPAISAIRDELHAEVAQTWCIFDNTASGAALGHALALT